MADPLSTYDPFQRVEVLADLRAAEFVATQLNDEKQNGNRAEGAPRIVDLTEAITDIQIETVVQGAGTLTVYIADPWWGLLTRVGESPAFIDVDDAGLLIPVDVNFPQGTDMWWRLCAASPSTDTTQANLVLTFEDRIASELRDLGGPKTAGNNMTRAQFIASLVAQVPDIRFVCPALSQPAGSVGGDITQGQINSLGNTSAPKSALNPTAPAARRNPTKNKGLPKGAKTHGETWTKSGWRYTKPINGKSPLTLSLLNPPTNQPDGPTPDPASGIPGIAVIPGI